MGAHDPMGIYSIRVPIWSETSTHGTQTEQTLYPLGTWVWGRSEQTLYPLGTWVWGRSNSPYTRLPMSEKYSAQN